MGVFSKDLEEIFKSMADHKVAMESMLIRLKWVSDPKHISKLSPAQLRELHQALHAMAKATTAASYQVVAARIAKAEEGR